MKRTVDTYENLRQQQLNRLLERLGPMVDQLGFDAERLAAMRRNGLREIVAHAVEHSPFHAERLAGIDPASVTEAELSRIPTMSKADLREHFEDIVTDRRLTTDAVEAHIASLDAGDAYLFDTYHVVATGGSSGPRTVIVWDWDGWVDCFLTLGRRGIVQPPVSDRPRVMVSVSGDHASHMSAAIAQTFSSPLIATHRVPASLPVDQIVGHINGIQPTVLQGYPSMLHRLALEAQAGRLDFEPDGILCGSETLEPATRDLLRRTWNVSVQNGYGASEVGGIATDCGSGDGWMHLNDDVLIVEVEQDRILVTNLMNKVMPLIRYELDDRLALVDVDCPCGTSHRTVSDIQGRTSELFHFSGGATVHPIVFSSAIGTNPRVAEYQVRQSGDELSVDCVPFGVLDTSEAERSVLAALHASGAGHVRVSVRCVDDIPRTGATAKARRFIPDPG